MAGLALKLEVATVASIPGLNVGEECWNSDLYARLEGVVDSIHLEAVAASIQLEATVEVMSKSARLWETLLTTSQVLDPFENPVA
jgi:hypothetical protein